eukprot:7852796-Lingulodinium_polyedra.AAC.1
MRGPPARILSPLRPAPGNHGSAGHLPVVGWGTLSSTPHRYGPTSQHPDVHPRATSFPACGTTAAGHDAFRMRLDAGPVP